MWRALSIVRTPSGSLPIFASRFAKFGLVLHPEKTRLIEFGRFAAERRQARGLRKPETFEFLGFTHICAKGRHGRFKLKRVTSKKKMRAKLQVGQDRDAATDASPDPRTGTLARQGPARALQLLRGARQHRGACAASENGSSGTGATRFRVAARTAGSPGREPAASLIAGCPNPGSFTPGPNVRVSTPEPKGGAQCVDAHAGIRAGGCLATARPYRDSSGVDPAGVGVKPPWCCVG